jgi:hypothetical protein
MEMQQREHAEPVGPLPPDWGYAFLSVCASLDERSCFHFVSAFPEFLSRWTEGVEAECSARSERRVACTAPSATRATGERRPAHGAAGSPSGSSSTTWRPCGSPRCRDADADRGPKPETNSGRQRGACSPPPSVLLPGFRTLSLLDARVRRIHLAYFLCAFPGEAYPRPLKRACPLSQNGGAGGFCFAGNAGSERQVHEAH